MSENTKVDEKPGVCINDGVIGVIEMMDHIVFMNQMVKTLYDLIDDAVGLGGAKTDAEAKVISDAAKLLHGIYQRHYFTMYQTYFILEELPRIVDEDGNEVEIEV